jgi:hypothetical protein
MQGSTKRSAPLRGSIRVAKLLRVVVMGGAVLASNCTTTPSKGSGSDSSSQGGASRDGRTAPEQGGGVPGW